MNKLEKVLAGVMLGGILLSPKIDNKTAKVSLMLIGSVAGIALAARGIGYTTGYIPLTQKRNENYR